MDFSGWVNVPDGDGEVMFAIDLVARHANNGDLQTFVLASFTDKTDGWAPVGGSVVMPNRTAVARLQIRVAKEFLPRLDSGTRLVIAGRVPLSRIWSEDTPLQRIVHLLPLEAPNAGANP